jgi:hypothetical protein
MSERLEDGMNERARDTEIHTQREQMNERLRDGIDERARDTEIYTKR